MRVAHAGPAGTSGALRAGVLATRGDIAETRLREDAAEWKALVERLDARRVLDIGSGLHRLPEVGEFVRQHVVRSDHGTFIAQVDLSRPDIGFFIEMDGQQHKDQPVYDAMRETAVVGATGWLPGRFTWTEVRRLPNTTKRRLAAVARQAHRRHSSSPK